MYNVIATEILGVMLLNFFQLRIKQGLSNRRPWVKCHLFFVLNSLLHLRELSLVEEKIFCQHDSLIKVNVQDVP